ncbi:hypothetical protein [Vibrio marisflavi]|uniref:Uncharacterized protein n=1 Tax=Vibrio marisflavi CECT 7928 TaxID=634439 RepID=A0ABM9AAK4_9VIBR|nr:hypothetical protein [Vibrio marisflavi]CAH0543238.1 hypothetical protein VMF7928_04486 [Vibrio marisflavi CECT 7928]
MGNNAKTKYTKLQVIATPQMELANFNRTIALRKIESDQGPNIWLTDSQTGCTVVIIKWPDNRVSMIHLMPAAGDISDMVRGPNISLYTASKRLMYTLNDSYGGAVVLLKSQVKEAYMLEQLSHLIRQSTGNTEGCEFIVVPSNVARMCEHKLILVVGVRERNSWSFYKQTKSAINGKITEVKQLQWQSSIHH